MPKDVTSWLLVGAAICFVVVFIRGLKNKAFDFTALGLTLLALGLFFIGQ